MGVGKLYGAVVRKESMDGERGGRRGDREGGLGMRSGA